MGGSDPCDQDGRMESWEPFSFDVEGYLTVKKWWIEKYPRTVEDRLGVNSWDDWIQEIFEKEGL